MTIKKEYDKLNKEILFNAFIDHQQKGIDKTKSIQQQQGVAQFINLIFE